MTRLGLICAAALLASSAQAQDLVFSSTEMETCLSGAEDHQARNACIGQAAEQCMETTPGGYSTMGMGGCLWREAEYWDARLNAAYKALMADAIAMDEEMKSYGSSAPKQAPALREMQRAWIPFRDRKCDYVRSQWGGGTGGGPAGASCHLYTTAEQALFLEASGLGG